MDFDVRDKLTKIRRVDKRTGKVIESDYLEARYRIMWLKSEHPDWVFKTTVTLLPQNPNTVPTAAFAYCELLDGEGKLRGTGASLIKEEWFERFVEKACTAAESRAAAQAGYGTQWAIEYIEEGESVEELPDSPVDRKELITQEQEAYLLKIIKDKNIPVEEVKKTFEELGVKSIKELSKQQASALIDKFRKR